MFFGSPPFATAVFEALAQSEHIPVGLVTGPERPAGRGGRGGRKGQARAAQKSALVAAAEAIDIPVFRPANPHDPTFLDELRALNADVFTIASYGFLMKPELFEMPALGSLNVHASLLPRWRGASPIQRAIEHGDEVTGVTIQRIVMKLDAGDVLLARELAIPPDATSGELLELLAPLGGSALVDALDVLGAGRADFRPQDESAVTYAKKLEKRDGDVDWGRPAVELARHVRAMTPWPGARAWDPKGRALTLVKVAPTELEVGATTPGTLVATEPGPIVATGEGVLEIIAIKPAGKREMSGAEYLRGARLEAGARFGAEPDSGARA